MVTTHSRTSPSPRYGELLSQYRTMHTRGEQHQNLPPEQTFNGQSMPRHSQNIKQLIDAHSAKTILDYGSGKGVQYTSVRISLPGGQQFATIPDYWAVDSVTCYDPGYEPFSRLPTGKFDGVICTDVLEHCPREDMPWIVNEIFSFARKFVYANVACYPAKKHLSNGENAHCTIETDAWWQALIGKIACEYPSVRYFFFLEHKGADGQGMTQTLIKG